MKKLIVSGASNTNAPWPTWVDFVKESYICKIFDVSKKGMGNEAIITTSLHEAMKKSNVSDEITIIIMLTSIDKWDWYVDNYHISKKLSKEKHNVTKLNSKSHKGFWCTGSHFPLYKKYFKKNYYSEEYFTFKTIQMINMFQNVCNEKNWNYHIMFDSPIWSMTEREINQNLPIDTTSFKLIKNDLCEWAFNLLNIPNIDNQGLIGFLNNNKIPHYSSVYGAHPGPLAHWEYAKFHLFPILDNYYQKKYTSDYVLEYAKKMNNLWIL